MATKADTAELTPQQQAAADALAAGSTVTEAAAAVNVSRQTVSEWLHHDHGFRVELNRRRAELWASSSDRLRALLPKALDVVAAALDGYRPLPAALAVLKAVGLHALGAPSGATTLEDAKIEDQEAEAERHNRATLAALWP